MVWAGFCYLEKLLICFVWTRMNSNDYVSLLGDVLISFLDSYSEEQYIFQQDNAAIYVPKQNLKWFSDKNITVMPWPACSTDRNPMENLWAVLASKVYDKGKQYSTNFRLKCPIMHAWEKINPDVLKKLIGSMHDRIFGLIL